MTGCNWVVGGWGVGGGGGVCVVGGGGRGRIRSRSVDCVRLGRSNDRRCRLEGVR